MNKQEAKLRGLTFNSLSAYKYLLEQNLGVVNTSEASRLKYELGHNYSMGTVHLYGTGIFEYGPKKIKHIAEKGSVQLLFANNNSEIKMWVCSAKSAVDRFMFEDLMAEVVARPYLQSSMTTAVFTVTNGQVADGFMHPGFAYMKSILERSSELYANETLLNKIQKNLPYSYKLDDLEESLCRIQLHDSNNYTSRSLFQKPIVPKTSE